MVAATCCNIVFTVLYICVKEEGGVKIEYTSGREQPSVTGIQRNVKIRTNAAEWCRIKDLNKRTHPMLVISRLQPRNSESEWVGGVM